MFRVPGVLLSQSNHKVLFNFKSIKLKHDWVAPEGFDTGIKVYCRNKKELVPLILLNKHFVKWYICGPTVYDVSHVGHASCYIRFDIINRILREFFNIRPVVALGITDIDDKIIKESNNRKVDFRTLAKQYELDFFNDMKELNILPSSFVLRVSEHIPDIINFVSKILDKGDAYVAEDGSVYFSNPTQEDSETEEKSFTQEPLNPGQKNYSDFALWKGIKPDEPYWESPWGKGRPGWHIECSAMASKLFGSQLDLHGGGKDLMFPHHLNEEIQSCSYHGCHQWVNYWLHTGQLVIADQKMSKSLKNYISISDFLKSYSADHLRMLCFLTKYSKDIHYREDSLSLAVGTCDAVSRFLADSTSYVKGNWSLGNVSESVLLQKLNTTSANVRQHLMNDFDTGQCRVALMDLIKTAVKMISQTPDITSSRSPAAVAAVAQYVGDVFKSFGFQLGMVDAFDASKDGQKLELLLDQIVSFRSMVRMEAIQCREKSLKTSLLQACDLLRSELKSLGIAIKDQKDEKAAWSFVGIQKRNAE